MAVARIRRSVLEQSLRPGPLFDEAQRYGVNLMDAHHWWDLHEYAVELLNRIVPQIDVVSMRDGSAGCRNVAAAWIAYLNARAGFPLYRSGFPKGHVEVKVPGREPAYVIWPERELSKGYVIFDPSLHRDIRAPNIPFSWDEFINFQTALGARQDIFWMILLGTDPYTVPRELLSHCRVLVSSIPMWFGSVSMESPMARFYPSSTVEEGTMEQLIRDSHRLIDSGCVWYSDIGRIQAIREAYPSWRTLTLEKCTSPRQWLDRLSAMKQQPGDQEIIAGMYEFGHDNVLIAACKEQHTLTFSLASELATIVESFPALTYSVKPPRRSPQARSDG